MKRIIRNGPKRLRWRRRDWSGSGGIGQERRWDDSSGNFKAEREARRAGVTGKATKHREQPAHRRVGVIFYGEPYDWQIALALQMAVDPRSGAPATDVREAGRLARETQRGGEEEETDVM